MEDIKGKVQEIFREIFDDETIVLEESMTSEDINGWDSLTHFQMIMEIEVEFDVKFTTKEIAELSTVGELINMIENYLIDKNER